MFTEFDAAINDFGQVYLELDSSLVKVARVSNQYRHKAGNCAYDIISFAPIFKDIHLQAVATVQAEENHISYLLPKIIVGFQKIQEELLKGNYSEELLQQVTEIQKELKADSSSNFPYQDTPEQRLKVIYKAMFYFIRAYQDTICGILLELKGHKAGQYTSMNDALKKENNPVRIAIMETIPEYKDWFYRWKLKRDIIKLGINLGISGPGSDLGIAFSSVDKSGGLIMDCQDTIRLSDVVEAIKMSTRLAKTALALSKAKQVA